MPLVGKAEGAPGIEGAMRNDRNPRQRKRRQGLSTTNLFDFPDPPLTDSCSCACNMRKPRCRFGAGLNYCGRGGVPPLDEPGMAVVQSGGGPADHRPRRQIQSSDHHSCTAYSQRDLNQAFYLQVHDKLIFARQVHAGVELKRPGWNVSQPKTMDCNEVSRLLRVPTDNRAVEWLSLIGAEKAA